MVTGFILVRLMTKSDYAWFTISNGALATLAVLADSGLGSAFTSLGGKVYGEKGKLSALVILVRRKRFLFLLLSAALTLPLATWALVRNGAPLWMTGMMVILILLAAVPAADSVVLMTVNKLHNRIPSIIAADLWMNFSRLLLIAMLCALGVSAVGVLFCILASIWIQLIVLKRQTADDISATPNFVKDYGCQINRTVASVLPITIFTCFHSQLSTYLLSFFARVDQVADLGALTRLGVAFVLLALPLSHFFVPAIARCQEQYRLKKLILLTILIFTGAAVSVVALSYFCSPLLLGLLGAKYAHLHLELLLFMAASSLGFISNAIWGIAFARGWVRRGWITIPLSLTLQLAVIAWIDFTSVTSVILFSAVGSVAFLAVGIFITTAGYQIEFPSKASNRMFAKQKTNLI